MSDGTLTERERLVYSAKLAEQAERYDGTSGPGRCFIYGIGSRQQRTIADGSRRAASPPRGHAATARHPRDLGHRFPRDVA